MIDSYPTTSEAREQAEEYATPLNKLINPNDVQGGAEQWTDIDAEDIRFECAESAEVVATEHDEMRNLIQDTAFRLWVDGFRRVSRDVLGDAPDSELIHVFNIWPNEMDKWEMYEIAHKVYEDPNFRIPNDCYDEAREAVITGLVEGTKPE
jgi:hypothetical protein